MRVLNDITSRDRNNFDLIRLFAALAVIFGHSFYLFPNGGHQEPVTQIIDKNFSGTLAVGVFFFLSGIFVAISFVQSESAWRFILLRVSRIYPGSLVCLFLLAFVVGPIVTAIPVADYFHSSQTYNFARDNWSFFSFLSNWPEGSTTSLPGVFNGNAANGSLSTLHSEIACYTLLFAFGITGALTIRWAVNFSAVTLVALHFVAPSFIPYFSDAHYSDPLKQACCFLAGTVVFANRDRVVLRWRYAMILIALAAVMNRTLVAEYFIYAALLYSVLMIGATGALRRVKLPGDYSFGVYIYGWPVQETVAHYLPNITSYPSNLITIPVALLLGYLSWTG
jgi:peptidoglycan/LPS O-acetylase OafA/YrhL